MGDRELCYQLIYKCLEEGAFSNLALKDTEVTDFVRAAVYGTITYSMFIDRVIDKVSKTPSGKLDARTRTIVRFGAWQILFSDKVPDYAAVNSSVELAKKYKPEARKLVNALLRKISDLPDEMKNPEAYKPEIGLSLKPEIFGILKKSYGKEHAASIGKSLLEVGDISLRFNINRYSKSEITDILSESGAVISESSFMDCAVCYSGNGNLENLKCFKDGDIFVQNEAAMLASVVASPKDGDRILDCCSAPGGKTTHMAEIAKDECEIFALDINESRLELIRENIDRLKLKSIRPVLADSTDLSSCPELSGMKGTFDIVTCDVPCSGLGLMARKPDIRHTISYERIQELLPKQYVILNGAAEYVKKGGRLVYSTCTLNRDENEEQVLKFLSEHPDFEAENITSKLPVRLSRFDGRDEDAKNGYITLFPDIDKCDGFFVASFRKK